MSEIEKMYENAGIKPIAEYCKHQCNNEFDDDACIGCVHIEKVEYPPFTAEKELKLIKWFMHSGHFSPIRFYTTWVVDDIASHINFLWKKLTEEEKQQVKGILK